MKITTTEHRKGQNNNQMILSIRKWNEKTEFVNSGKGEKIEKRELFIKFNNYWVVGFFASLTCHFVLEIKLMIRNYVVPNEQLSGYHKVSLFKDNFLFAFYVLIFAFFVRVSKSGAPTNGALCLVQFINYLRHYLCIEWVFNFGLMSVEFDDGGYWNQYCE